MGMIDAEPEYDVAGKTYKEVMEQLFDAPLEETIPAKLRLDAADSPVEPLRYIGMLADEPIDTKKASMLDLMADCMARTLVYKEGERDMLLQRHDLTFTYPEDRKETVTAIMVDYGIPGGDSSMARTVSLPAAIGVRMILEGKITLRGVQIPILPDIYVPVLDELETLGITFEETRAPA
jgi:saccharopine dehydrogenase-like NADP-dependent oxidoreductase